MIPRVSELQQQNNRQEIILITAQIMRKLAAIYFPIYVFLLLMGREFITVLFTKTYLPSWPIFAVFLSLIPINILTTDPVMRAYAEQRYFLLRVKIAIFAMLFVTLWFGIRHLSLVGVITIVVAANILERTIAALRAGRVLGVGWHHASLVSDLPKLAAAAIGSGVITAVVYLLLLGHKPLLILCVCGAVFTLCYSFAIFLLKIPTIEERAYARQLINRLWRAPGKRVPESLS
jgi:O-antigen/teichoic acid export membrane protein